MTVTNVPELVAAQAAAEAEEALKNRLSSRESRPEWRDVHIAQVHATLAIHHDLRRIADALEGATNR